MTEKPSILDNLVHRRVPHFVGMYVAATWLVIELGDWITERFNLPGMLTSYVFVAMLVMLPAIIIFSYNHGAPGKDRWTTTERVLIPLNAVLALGILYFLSPSLDVEASTETVQITDETGTVQQFEVARQGYHQEVIGYFWQNDSRDKALDWLSYGLPLMLAHDLNRVSPVITVETPFDSSSMRNELRSRGYPSFLDEPQGLRVEIARERRSAAFVVGRFSAVDGVISVNATLVDAASGNEIGSHSVSGSDWFAAVDDVSAAVLEYLEIEPSDNQSDDPIRQHFTDSLEAVRHFTNGHVALDIDNDYTQGIAELTRAIELDDGFAEAGGVLSMTHYFNSDIESARASASLALKNSYRLSETSKFLIKANRYIFDGDYDRGERVVEMWTEVQPNSTDAFAAMAQINRLRSTAASLQKASDAYDRLLELDPGDYSVYRQKAEVEQQRGDYAAAAGYLRNFLEQEVDSSDAYIQLAGVYQAAGDLEAAQESLEDAAILSDSPLESDIGLARLEARRGLFKAAEERLAALLVDDLGSQQRVQVLSAQLELAFVTGQIERGIDVYLEINETAKSFMPPMVRLVSVENQHPTLLTLLGRTDEAIAVADEISAQLQPPIDAYILFTYTSIYDAANDREAYREIATKAARRKNQLPPLFQPFIDMQSARAAIWDEEFDVALSHLGRARESLGQSFIQVFQDNLGTSSLHVMLAELYLEAQALDEARKSVDGILRLFPASGHAKLLSAKIYLTEGNDDAARETLAAALETWSDADAEFVYLVETKNLMNNL